MLKYRILAATGIVLIVAGAMVLDFYIFRNSLMLHVVFLFITWQCFREFWPLCRAVGEETFSNWGTGSGLALVMVHFWVLHMKSISGTFSKSAAAAENALLGAMALAFLGAFVLSARRGRYKATLGSLGVTVLGLIYLWFLPSFVFKLRHMGTNGQIGGDGWIWFGQNMLIATIVVSKGCDIFAYFSGKSFGKRKAFPNLSPGKTIAGVVGGLIGGALLAILLQLVNIIPDYVNILYVIIFGLAIGFSGILGDLAESLLKRSAGAKDAGHSVPGFGGMLDVIDSLVVAGPVAYFLVPAIMRG